MIAAWIINFVYATSCIASASEHENLGNDCRIGVISDFGHKDVRTERSAALINGWNKSERRLDAVITLGDNDYGDGHEQTVNQPYAKFLPDRFYPCMGNHDFKKDSGRSYLDHFKKYYYYDFIIKNIYFFSICSDRRCPDGTTLESQQMRWFRKKLWQSSGQWKIVYFHHPLYLLEVQSRGEGPWLPETIAINSETTLDPAFLNLAKVNLVLSGHLHVYERIVLGNINYVTNGLGGSEKYRFLENIHPYSKLRFADDDGAMLTGANTQQLMAQFIAESGQVIDQFTIKTKGL